MSVTTTTNDGDVPDETESQFEKDAQAALDTLPERYQEHSKSFINSVGTKYVQLIPETKFRDEDHSSVFIYGTTIRPVVEQGFTFAFSSETRQGAGLAYWFEYDGE